MDLHEFSTNLDSIKRQSKHKIDYWMARDIQPYLGYDQWRNFESVVERAIKACESAGGKSEHHFAEVSKKIQGGKGAELERQDFYLSRFACYLIAMNGDTRKPEVGLAQTYFAVQTRRQEVSDQVEDDEKRLALRERVANNNKYLSSAAKKSGVTSPMFGIFHNEGYKGLYGGLGLKEIKRKKGIPEKEDLLDRASRAELAANDFRITQTEEQLASVIGEDAAIKLHHKVGKQVRDAIKNINGTMPENFKPAPHIKAVKKELKKKSTETLKGKKEDGG